MIDWISTYELGAATRHPVYRPRIYWLRHPTLEERSCPYAFLRYSAEMNWIRGGCKGTIVPILGCHRKCVACWDSGMYDTEIGGT